MKYIFEKRKEPFVVNRLDFGLSPQPHIHPHVELIYLLRGSSVASLDGREHLLQPGDLLVSFPNQIHFYHDRCSTGGYCLIFDMEIFPDLAGLFMNKMAADPVIKRADLPEDMASQLERIAQKLSGSRFDRIEAKGHMLALLAQVIPLLSLVDAPASHDSIKSVLIYCMENYTEPLTLDILARELHLNKFYISHIFQKRIEMGFSDFLNTLRLEHACELLSKDRSVTEVAYAAGFSSIRSFNRIFAQKMNMTPTQYIRHKQMR